MNEKYIEQRFHEAADTLKRLQNLNNRDMPKSIQSAWPDIVHSFYEAYGWNNPKYVPARPTATEISRLDEVIDWSLKVSERDRRILWERAFNIKWRYIQRRLNCRSRTTAWRLWVEAIIRISVIANRCVFKHNGQQYIERVEQKVI